MTKARLPGLALVIGLVLSAALPRIAAAQGLVNRALASRDDLENLLNGTGTTTKLTSRQRELIQHRLQEGDFQPGDRVYLQVRGEQALTDTFTVKAGQILALPDMAPLSLHGVLRSEVQEKLLAHIGQYIKEPNVSAQPLLRVGILGAVGRPGYYPVRADQALGDLLAVASGPAPDADLEKMSVQRDGKEYWSSKEVRQAMASGKSLDLLGFQNGDEVLVGRRGGGFGPTLAILTGVATLVTTILLISRH